MKRVTKLSSQNDNVDSLVIHYLRFPLAVLVVILHAEPHIVDWDITQMESCNIGANIAGTIMYSMSHVFTQVAVPTFFLISGFLFFKGLEKWDKFIWKRKIKSRFSSLIFPYIIWVSLFALVNFTRHVMPTINASNWQDVMLGWFSEQGGFANIYWSSSLWIAGDTNLWGQKIIMSGPLPFHLWFLRDLIVSVFLTPIFYLFFRQKEKGKLSLLAIASVLILALLCFTQTQSPVRGISFSTLFYFGLGAFLSINKFSLTNDSRIIVFFSGLLSLGLFVALIPLNGAFTHWGTILFPFYAFSTILSLLTLSRKYVIFGGKNYLGSFESTSFFVYVIHPFFLSVAWTLLSKISCLVFSVEDVTSLAFANQHPIVLLLMFFGKILAALVVSIVIYKMIAHISPRLAKQICGR